MPTPYTEIHCSLFQPAMVQVALVNCQLLWRRQNFHCFTFYALHPLPLSLSSLIYELNIYIFISVDFDSEYHWLNWYIQLYIVFSVPHCIPFQTNVPKYKIKWKWKKRSRDEKEYIGDGSVGTTTMRSMCQAHGKMSQLASVYVSRVCKEANASVWFIVSIHTLAPTCRQVSLIRCWSAMCCPGERKEKRGQM